MIDDSGGANPPREDGLRSPSDERVDGIGKRPSPELDRLPPPAFPPGARRRHLRRQMPTHAASTGEGNGDVPDDAFILPDEPLGRASEGVPDDAFVDPEAPISPPPDGIADDAFIDPDTPIVRTTQPQAPDDYEEVLRGSAEGFEGGEDVLVTGIGDDPHLDDHEVQAAQQYGDVHVADLVKRVRRLADTLESKGEAGLKVEPDMVRFEVTLRAYCVGYLAGRREAEPVEAG